MFVPSIAALSDSKMVFLFFFLSFPFSELRLVHKHLTLINNLRAFIGYQYTLLLYIHYNLYFEIVCQFFQVCTKHMQGCVQIGLLFYLLVVLPLHIRTETSMTVYMYLMWLLSFFLVALND